MSPVEIYIDGERFAETGSGPSEIRLPNPPGGSVAWNGDRPGSGLFVGHSDEPEYFELMRPGEEVVYRVPRDLVSVFFEKVADAEAEIRIKRIESRLPNNRVFK